MNFINSIKRLLGFGGKYPGDEGYWTGTDWYVTQPSHSGEKVTEESALRLSAVYRCDRVLCDTIASLPIDVYRRTEKGSEIAENHPIQYILKHEPNEWQSSFTLRETSQHLINFTGDVFWKIDFNGNQRAGSLRLLDPNKMTVEFKGGKLLYKFDKNTTYRPDQVVHITNLSIDGITGRGYLQAARETIGQGLAMNKYASLFFRNDATPRFALSTDANLKTDQIQEFQSILHKFHSGDNRHKPMILSGGFKPVPLGMTHEDSQFLESRKFGVTDVCRFFGVPPHLAYDLERATFSNIEHQQLEFVIHTVRPLVKRWEAELNRKLLTEKEKKSGSHYIRFNLEGLLRGDHKARGEFYKTMTMCGAIVPNEIRAQENMNSVSWGDVPYPINMKSENGGRTPD